MAEVDDWAPVGTQAAPEVDDWKPVAKPEDPTALRAPTLGGFLDRAKKGFSNYPSDVADFFMEGVHAMTPGPSMFDDLGPKVEQQLISTGSTPENAKRQTASLMQSWKRQESLWGGLGGALQAVTAPVIAPLRSFITRPLEEETGFPKEMSETLLFSGAAAFGGRGMTRVKVEPNGKVTAQAIGELPKDADFKTAAELVSDGKKPEVAEQNLRTLWEERGIHPAEAVHDANRDVWTKHQIANGIDAYHGSPHDFAAFDISKIGAGEGAQSYGHGLYFAENKDVALSYKDMAPREIPPGWKAEQTSSGPGQFDNQWKVTGPDGKTFETSGVRNAQDAIRQVMKPEGNLYRVRIHADREHFLDWDKPLSEQSPEVQKAVAKIAPEILDTALGQGVLALIGDLRGLDKAGVSEALRDAGIPGIKYLDQGSRPQTARISAIENGIANQQEILKGIKDPQRISEINNFIGEQQKILDGLRQQQPTSNFVVFDDKPIEITHKNGEPVTGKERANALEQARTPQSLGAAANTDPPLTPLAEQPPPPPGRISAAVQNVGNFLLDIGRDIQMKVAPMATGTMESIAAAKDFANNMRRNRWEWARYDNDLVKRFNPEQRERMWNAADEESVARQLGESREHQGLVTLTPEERAAVEDLHARAQTAWLRVRDLGMVESEGLPAYTPRMVINTANAVAENKALPLNSIGQNLKATSPNLRRRKYTTAEETEAAAKAKYGEAAEIARDIRSLPLATAKLEDAIAGRTLINNIREIGKRGGDETVSEGSIPAGSEHKWFTLDHPAFKTWRPKFEEVDGKMQPLRDSEGNIVFEQVPLYIRGDFEGPLRAVLNTKNGPVYNTLMDLKGKTMSVVMYSPAIHNMVEFGRAFPAMPTRIFKAYFDGNRAKNDVALMTEAIDNGLVPIGKRFFKQDIDSVMEAPDLSPGRTWTAKLTSAILTSERLLPQTDWMKASSEADARAIKRGIDRLGDFWHNTLLWDRIGDLQMGIYVNLRGDMIGKGVDQQTASRVAAHFANRYAGALPQEAMSAGARKFSNFLLFSRTFTMGNLGVMKDMVTGLPKDVMAQIERDMGTVNPEAAGYAKSLARRKAMMVVALDIGLLYVGNSILQSALNVMLGDRTIDEESHGYARRFKEVFNDVTMHPLQLLQPFSIAEKLSATSENEPGRKERLRIGNTADGTAIYARNPIGKIGEEFLGFMSSPIDMLKRKEGTIARPMLQVISNDKGFGRKVYDPDADTPAKYASNIWAIVEHFLKAQTPEGQINAASDLVKGDGDPKLNTLQLLGPLAGVTFSKGAPGGPAAGELYHARTQHDFQVNLALPDIRKQINRGDIGGAIDKMTELGIAPGLQRYYIRTTLNPATRVGGRTLMDFYRYSTPEQRERLERARSGQ